ncbi:hypothetical protein BDP55DRAFT_669543 [Colletotrichum godetiae]|uniref:Uncharacterized protein n=1 Tax=Colletotrichum godetiae TaxID=1209918 RepID=A0AAJ0ETQ4_9PEZI|nr:uncharacterized protein BDP55DRAFT_669543 [Colletotrichum godetiae]KAK1673553.1 hypothetical protein BDP55DRAFT_669543 [Colletotrichum godetiae]
MADGRGDSERDGNSDPYSGSDPLYSKPPPLSRKQRRQSQGESDRLRAEFRRTVGYSRIYSIASTPTMSQIINI